MSRGNRCACKRVTFSGETIRPARTYPTGPAERRLHTAPRRKVCDTYTVWSPTLYTVTARCSCGWAGTTLPQEEIVASTNEEIEHLWEAVVRMQAEEEDQTDVRAV